MSLLLGALIILNFKFLKYIFLYFSQRFLLQVDGNGKKTLSLVAVPTHLDSCLLGRVESGLPAIRAIAEQLAVLHTIIHVLIFFSNNRKVSCARRQLFISKFL